MRRNDPGAPDIQKSIPNNAKWVTSDHVAIRGTDFLGFLSAIKQLRFLHAIVNLQADLVAAGLVASLARPGGNVTGVQILNSDLIPKQLAFLKELLPNLSRIAFLQDYVTSVLPQVRARYDQNAAAAARTLSLTLHTVIVNRPRELAAAFLGMTKNGDQGLVVLASPFSVLHRKEIVELAAKHRIATIYESDAFLDAGGLMSYGASRSEIAQRNAVFVDKILRGAKPPDLPVEQPTKFELVINLKTAKALGLTVPQAVLLRADRAIE